MSAAFRPDKSPVLASPYATLREASAYSRLSTRTLRRAIAAGRLKAHRGGSRVLLKYKDLDSFITGQVQD